MTSETYILRRAGRAIRRPQLVVERFKWWFARYQKYQQMKLDLAAVRRECDSRQSLREKVEAVVANPVFGALQKAAEMTGLLEILQKNPPRCVCEIGTAAGGTLFLLTQVSAPDALLLSVDLGLPLENSLVYRRFAGAKQKIVSIRGDSRAPRTIARVRSALRGQPLDLLFIDGDHSYAGVKADFHNYSALVPTGGLIAFHDIVTDSRTRYGNQDPAAPYTGQVPVFWQELKARYRTEEIVEHPDQDGYGIGVVYA